MFLLVFAVFAQAAMTPARRKMVLREPARATPITGPIETLLVSPLYDRPFACVEHHAGQMDFTGDALGTDCMIVGGIEDGGFARLYRTDGKTNADWYGWQAPVYAPIDGKIVGLFSKDAVNSPGTLGKPPAGMIQIERADGVLVTLGHVAGVRVKAGDTVKAGQPIASVGNNGVARAPHSHIGAARGAVPLQIRWDQKAMARMFAR